MLLTGHQIKQYLKDNGTNYYKVNQVGIDLSVNKIEKIIGGVMVFQDKTVVNPELFINIELMNIEGRKMWRLERGAYALTFNEGVKIPADATGFITSRSSIYRGGAKINSPVWDPGFETDVMGTTMFVESETIFIEENARVGQFYMITNPIPQELYNGQFQGKTNY
jgi:dUTP pyrophosphatase